MVGDVKLHLDGSRSGWLRRIAVVSVEPTWLPHFFPNDTAGLEATVSDCHSNAYLGCTWHGGAGITFSQEHSLSTVVTYDPDEPDTWATNSIDLITQFVGYTLTNHIHFTVGTTNEPNTEFSIFCPHVIEDWIVRETESVIDANGRTNIVVSSQARALFSLSSTIAPEVAMFFLGDCYVWTAAGELIMDGDKPVKRGDFNTSGQDWWRESGRGFYSIADGLETIAGQMFMLSETNALPRFVEYFTSVTNQLLSSGQPLPWIEVGNGGN